MNEPHERESKARGTIDWDAAFEYYASLGLGARSFAKVARKFVVSDVSVGKAAARLGWQDRVEKIDRKAQVAVAQRVVRAREVRVAETINLIDRARQQLDARLEAGDVTVDPGEFVHLVKLEQLLEGEATERVDVRKVSAVIVALIPRIGRLVPSERIGELHQLLDELESELAALERAELRVVDGDDGTGAA